MTVTTRLGVAFGAIVLLLGALLMQHVGTIRRTVTTARQLSEISARLDLSATRQQAWLAQLEESAAKYSVTQDRGYLAKLAAAHTAYSTELAQAGTLELSPAERTALTALTAAWERLGGVTGGSSLQRRRLPPLPVVRAAIDTLRAGTFALSAASRATMRRRLDASATAADRAERVSWLAAAAAILLSLLTGAWLVRSISDPLRRLSAGTREVALGRFDYRLATEGGDEFAQVASAFNAMTERLSELDQMKQNFVSGLSHDLKTPLASMRETTALLLDELAGPLSPTQRKVLLLQEESGGRLATMLGKVLDLSRLESAPPLAIAVIDIAALARDAVERARPLGAKRGIRVTLSGPPGEIRIACDPDRVQQVIANLLENAIKFSPADETIDVTNRVAGSPPAWEFTCADRGPGIPLADQGRVFDRFFQTEAGRALPGRGVGLGLTICREIVLSHGGTIRADSRPDGGALFQVRLPGVQESRKGDLPARIVTAQRAFS